MKPSLCLVLILTPGFLCTVSRATPTNKAKRSDHHAPVGVMHDHTHPPGVDMVAYQYSLRKARGLIKGGDTFDANQVLNAENPYVLSTSSIEVHHLSLMVSYDEPLTIRPFVSIYSQSYTAKTMSHGLVEIGSKGAGLAGLDVLYNVTRGLDASRVATLSISSGVGANQEVGRDAFHQSQRLPERMQPGEAEGAYLYASYVENHFFESFSLGALAYGQKALSSSDSGVKTEEWGVSGFFAFLFHPSLSTSLRYQWLKSFYASKSLTGFGPTFSEGARSLERHEVYFGMNYVVFGQRFSFEYGEPLAQYATGYALHHRSLGLASWQFTY